jgi:hypothetical protein
MNPNVWIGLICLILAALLLLALTISLIREVQKRSYDAGYLRERAEADGWWEEQGKQVDQERQKVWREEAQQ